MSVTEKKIALYPDTAKLFYEESKSAKEHLDGVLNQYRSNTSVVLTLATGATTLFGFADSGAGFLRWLTLSSYAVAVAFAISIFLPRSWPFNVAYDLRTTIDRLPIEKLHYDLAVAYQRQDDHARASDDSDVGEFMAMRGLADPAGARIMAQRSPCPDGSIPVPVQTPDGKTYWKCV